MEFTEEQLRAIERREGDLLLDAGAGSGKTAVLVERFVRAVIDDGVDVGRILAITFTEKAAAELRDRVRARLRDLDDQTSAAATEGAWISTIHAFCARVLHTHALAAGLDPAFTVLDDNRAAELSGAAFDGALAELARSPQGAELVAAHEPAVLRRAVVAVYGQLRAIGQRRPTLPVQRPSVAADELAGGVRELAFAAARGLGEIDQPGVTVAKALDTLTRAGELLAGELPWPGDLEAISLPGGAGALTSDPCEAYRAGLAQLRQGLASELAIPMRDALDELLRGYGERYGQLKQRSSALDFDDLELLARDLLSREEIGSRYRERFEHVMVDELQDTNRVQLELIELVAAGGALFMVGDAQQSIYGFRNANVELFEERGRELERVGGRASLTVNFRSRPEILAVISAGFEELMENFRPLAPAREPSFAVSEPRVELRVIDKGADWEKEGLAAPWRLAEARALAHRLAALIGSEGCPAGEIVVLTRATTDLRAYERALEDAGVPTYVIGGRGYWTHPQVVQLVAYLRTLANPLDQEALYGTLLSPVAGLSLDGLVLYAAGAADEMEPADRAALERFERWLARERAAAARIGAEELIDRVLTASGYDAALLSLPDGRRRLANVRKLMRFAREWEAVAGPDLAGFVEAIGRRRDGAERESEAPVESEGLDAVRLMTIHRAKGLEFPVVCVADLGRGPTFRHELIRLSRDGERLGLLVGRPGTGGKLRSLDYEELAEERWAAEQAEERRLFYVAMTRARERLILSGAMRESGGSSTPADWIVPAFRDLPGVRYTWLSDDSEDVHHIHRRDGGDGRVVRTAERSVVGAQPGISAPASPAPKSPVPLRTLSYSTIAEHARCGYRFYVERVLGVPPTSEPASEGTGGRQRGTEVHRLLQRLDFRRPVIPSEAPADVATLLSAFAGSDTRRRLAAAAEVRREQRFAFPFAGTLVTGTFDVLALEAHDRLLVVDYKSDRLDGASPAEVEVRYGIQRLIYAIAALRTASNAGAGPHPTVEVVHLFLEAPDDPARANYDVADVPALEGQLEQASAGLRAGTFEVSPTPQLGLCNGCPAEAGLCSWPPELTRRSVVQAARTPPPR